MTQRGHLSKCIYTVVSTARNYCSYEKKYQMLVKIRTRRVNGCDKLRRTCKQSESRLWNVVASGTPDYKTQTKRNTVQCSEKSTQTSAFLPVFGKTHRIFFYYYYCCSGKITTLMLRSQHPGWAQRGDNEARLEFFISIHSKTQYKKSDFQREASAGCS